MSDYPVYSTLFSTIYDEQQPVGTIGRGTHYSVLRAVEWTNIAGRALALPVVHDFAVIWDEDHDTRVIPIIEKIYMAGLLSPVQFIGERKANLTVITDARYYFSPSSDLLHYEKVIQRIAEDQDDNWNADVGSFDRAPGADERCITGDIINCDGYRVLNYLRNIDSLWSLGHQPRGIIDSKGIKCPPLPFDER